MGNSPDSIFQYSYLIFFVCLFGFFALSSLVLQNVSTRFLLSRYLVPRYGNFLSAALWVSVAGVVLGVMQLMLVLAVMSGFQNLLRDRFTRITSELVVRPRGFGAKEISVAEKLKQVPQVVASTPFKLGQGMLVKAGKVGGVTLEGIDWETAKEVTPWHEVWQTPAPELDSQRNPHWIWIGNELAKKLEAKVGDTVEVLIPDANEHRTIPFTITAISKFGIYDHDLRYATIDLKVLADIFGMQKLSPLYKCKLANGSDVDEVAEAVQAAVGPLFLISKWSDLHQNLFLAVQHQKQLLFLVLEIVVALAGLNVINLLMMSAYHRRRDVAIMRAMGMKFEQVLLFFVAQGAAVGAMGIGLGVVLGYFACHLVERFQPNLLSESVYNVNRLPIRIQSGDVLLICIIAFILCVAMSVIPAIRAARLQPAKALRYE